MYLGVNPDTHDHQARNTPGEPAGIGPDITLQLNPNGISSTLIVIADLAVLEARAELLGLPTDFYVVEDPRRAVHGRLNVLPLSAATPVTAGQMDAKNSPYVINCLEQAVQLCEAKDCSGIVTGPINKAAINEAGIKFSGHTEWLAERTSTEKVVMMLATTKLRVALVTTHLPLRAVPDAITKSGDTNHQHSNQDLQHRFGLVQPRILVCGLNPHAGDGGYLGHEEIEHEPCLELPGSKASMSSVHYRPTLPSLLKH